jgi:hypothetical protein
VGVEAEGFLSAAKLTGHVQLVAEKLLSDGTRASDHINCTDRSGWILIGYRQADTVNQVGKGSDGAQDWVAGAALCAAKDCRLVSESKRSVGTPLEIPNAGEKCSGDELCVGCG